MFAEKKPTVSNAAALSAPATAASVQARRMSVLKVRVFSGVIYMGKPGPVKDAYLPPGTRNS
ncbi:hypothetical protein, partial [Pantoea sp. GbtcB22]|uniref:hypothetical protein n=1 Tax=Pantoea sp. GbtcB22 TaxID=2824767 RepID=UPI001C2F445F